MRKLKVNLVGVIVHGIGIYVFFFYIFQWSHGSNVTISVLIHTFMMMESLPSSLYLQKDNCAGQHKNRLVLGFLCLLVELGIFEKVKVSFSMVGHTLEDIDQVFSSSQDFTISPQSPADYGFWGKQMAKSKALTH